MEPEPTSISRPVPPIQLSEYVQNNEIDVREYKSTTPYKHFSQVDTQPDPSCPILNIDASKVQEEIAEGQRMRISDVNMYDVIEGVFFPRQRLKDAYFKVKNASLFTDDISFQRISATPGQRKPLNVQTAGTPFVPPSRGPSRPTSHTSSRIASRAPTQQSSNQSIVNQAKLCQVTQQVDFLNQLLPHITYWLTCNDPATTSSCSMFEGLRLGHEQLVCPYLTVVFAKEDEKPREFRDRAALIATSILSNHVKAVKLRGQGEWSGLRHYVILLDHDDFQVFETTPILDGGSGYRMLRIDVGSWVQDSNCHRFGCWVNEVHKWAIKVWKPMILTAVVALQYSASDGSTPDDAENDARRTANEWGGRGGACTRES